MNWTEYVQPRLLGRDDRRRRRARDGCDGVVRYLASLGDELHRAAAGRRAGHPAMGITFTVYSEGGNIDRAWPFDVIPRVISTQEWERIVRRAGPAARGPQPLHRRPLRRRSKIVADGVFPAELLADSVNFRPECVGARPRARHVGPHLRQRPRPRRRRHDLRARGQPAGAVRRVVHAREPPGHQAGVRRPVPRPRHPPRRQLPQPAARPARRRCRPGRARLPVIAVLTPGRLQLGLLRARLPRPADGRPPGRGQRPRRRRRRRRPHAHRRRPGAGRRDLPPGRRPVPRPRGVPARLDPRRARPHAGVAGRQRRHRQRARAPASPTTRSSTPTCPTSSATTSARSRTIANVPTFAVLRRRAAQPRARQPRRAGREAGQRVRRLRRVHRAPRSTEAEQRRGRRPGSRPIPATTSAQPILQLSTAPTLCDGERRPPPPRPAAVHPLRANGPTSPRAA